MFGLNNFLDAKRKDDPLIFFLILKIAFVSIIMTELFPLPFAVLPLEFTERINMDIRLKGVICLFV